MAAAFVTLKVPFVILVAPVYKLAPERTKIPAPVLVNAPVVLVLAPEMVKVLVLTSIVEVVPVFNV